MSSSPVHLWWPWPAARRSDSSAIAAAIEPGRVIQPYPGQLSLATNSASGLCPVGRRVGLRCLVHTYESF